MFTLHGFIRTTKGESAVVQIHPFSQKYFIDANLINLPR